MDDQTEHWLQKTWRPAIGVTYIIINVFDFIIFPVLWTLTGFLNNNHTPWHPLTLESAGLFHMAFGAILGVAAWSRGTEKVRNVFNPNDRSPDYAQRDYYHQDNSENSRPQRPSGRVPPRSNSMIDNEPPSVYRGERNRE